MANDKNYVSPGLLLQKSQDVMQIHEELTASLDRLTALVNSLEEVWSDDAQALMGEKYAQLRQRTLPNFLQLIENYGQVMRQRAESAMQDVDANKRAIQNFL